MKTLILCAACLATPAYGVDMLPYYETQTVKVEKVSHVSKKKPRKVVKKKATKPSPTKVYAAEYRTDEVMRCLAPVRVVGSQDVREGAAEESAKKGWMESVRWAHGEAFMDAANWTDMQRRCSRSSIGEMVGQVFYRCEIVASPCRPGMSKGGGQ